MVMVTWVVVQYQLLKAQAQAKEVLRQSAYAHTRLQMDRRDPDTL